ncbi:hypothetical protein BJ741DRAFT_628561 [Chytriomyces cf. hyalinus JEL632]|nr:hypothetical protein BJ741DRAFT_628561 [Chytriomyces cf. hyalinus JEL632]
MLNREHCRTTSSAAPPQPMQEAHRPTAIIHQTTTHSDPSPNEQQAPYSAHFPSMQSPIHTGHHHPYMSHRHNSAMNNSSNTSNMQTSNILLTDFEPANASPLLGSAIRHNNSQAYRYMHSVVHPQPMQSYDPTISMGRVGAPAAAGTAYYAVNGEPLDPLLIHPSMSIIPMMQMPSSSSSLSSRSGRQVPQKSFSAHQFEQFLAQPPPVSSAPSPPTSSSATTYSIPIAPLKSLDFADVLRESPNPPTPTNLNEKSLGAAAGIGTVESAAFVPTSFTENNNANASTTTLLIQPHILSNSLLEIPPIIECLPKKCSAKRSRITQAALLYLIDRFNENSSPSTTQLQMYAHHLNMDVPKLRIWFQNRRARQKLESRRDSV